MDATIKQEKKSNDKLMPKIKLILKSVREYKWYAVASPFAMILEALMEFFLDHSKCIQPRQCLHKRILLSF